MRDTLPSVPNEIECGIMNLDSNIGNGTHWTCWYKKSKHLCYYFDSFGINPPLEFEQYMKTDLLYSTYEIQQLNDVICGHLCLVVLYALMNNCDFHRTVLRLYSETK